MKKIFKIGGIVLIVLIIVLAGGLIYFNSAFPDVEPAPDIKVEITPERIERGKYLALHVSSCIDCHSERDWSKFSGPVVPGTYGKGGEVFNEEMGLPGTIYSKNITPAALGNYTDGELLRAFTQGVTKKGEALFPLMPYPNYNQMSTEDAYSVIAYLRTLEPIENEVGKTSLNFPLNFIVKTMPIKSFENKDAPDRNDTKAYGKYLVTLGACADCHTPAEKGEPLPGMYMAGGMKFELPMGTVRSVNITPDKETGIGNWTKEIFINRFKMYASDTTHQANVEPGEFNTIMPWVMYSGITEEDLGAMYDYLMTVPPVKNSVERFVKR